MNAEMPFIPQGRIELLPAMGQTVSPDPEHLAGAGIIGFGPMSDEIQPLMMIRSALLDHARATGHRRFAVTSAEPGNGKTHIAANLAAVLARVHPTVLVELDLRRPSLGQRLGLPEDCPGVDDFLAGDCPWAATEMRFEGVDLSIHRVRQPRTGAETLLAAGSLPLALDYGADAGAICIVDTPPAMLSDDLLLIARHVDGMIVVAEEGRSSKRGLEEIVRVASPTPVVGTVLNRSISQPRRRAGYDYYASPMKDAVR
ncbi:MAG TPA: CpsD/CapB family tyrosine-protein kinase [Novosphingobium sp.]|nr:CpsD/CapB family tyrosine-protein kinase [Novosphingobium sp.]